VAQTFYRLGTDDRKVMTAHVHWRANGMVLFDVSTGDGKKFPNRYRAERDFDNRWFKVA